MKTILLACLLFFVNLLWAQCPSGAVTLNSQSDVNNFVAMYPNCDNISGDLIIDGPITDLSALDYIDAIEGDFVIANTELISISNFSSLTLFLNKLEISNNEKLVEITGFNALIDLGNLFIIENNPNLVRIDGFNSATDAFGDLWINGNTSLQFISGFGKLVRVYKLLGISNSPLLQSIPSFNNMNSVGRTIQFTNTGLTDLLGFDNLSIIGGLNSTLGLGVSNNQNLGAISGFNCLKNIEFDLSIKDNPQLKSIVGLSSLERVGRFFSIGNNTSLLSLNGLQNLIEVSRPGYEAALVFEIYDNPQLSDCNALCNLLESNGIIGLKRITNNASGCDSESEIDTSNCIPFQRVSCTSLVSPQNGATNVELDADISWQAISGATSYFISIGTTSEGTEIINNLNVGNITTYILPNNLPENAEIFVKIKPNNDLGQAKCCSEESFMTKAFIPQCAALINPKNGERDVPITTSISWNAVSNVTGYFISLGTFSGGTDILDNFNVGNRTSYRPSSPLPENASIFTTITPYNIAGNSVDCNEEVFFTKPESLGCTALINPINGSIDVDVDATIYWNATPKATGYILSIGLMPFGTELVNNRDLGNVNAFDFIDNFPFDTKIYVSLIPYNSSGQGEACPTESFTTKRESIFVPDFFTPNNDGYNDVWLINDPLDEVKVVYIYSRYGKLLKTIRNMQNGWNGSFNNQYMPVDDYWYSMTLKNGKRINGHFTLKR
ncbi:T9SS type B sorting domain-containing protein [Algibacter mikhailovii]|uniref:T9SS type B sorting domain-containing protein n=1 Tax=Algibacter mikhailovii TaxID=425498 RepID=UPI001675F218|nr:T9SS type B sorting domain-containing protein [Algibacter mikhailovii]